MMENTKERDLPLVKILKYKYSDNPHIFCATNRISYEVLFVSPEILTAAEEVLKSRPSSKTRNVNTKVGSGVIYLL